MFNSARLERLAYRYKRLLVILYKARNELKELGKLGIQEPGKFYKAYYKWEWIYACCDLIKYQMHSETRFVEAWNGYVGDLTDLQKGLIDDRESVSFSSFYWEFMLKSSQDIQKEEATKLKELLQKREEAKRKYRKGFFDFEVSQ